MELFISLVQQLIFLAALVAAALAVGARVQRIANNIRLGRALNRTDRPSERLKTMLLIAFGQKKMFDKPLVGLMHFVIYAAFIIVNIEVLEIVLDGLLGTHRLFAPYLGSAYTWLLNFFELLALGVVITCVIFLLRRNLKLVPRFWSREMTAWPRLDANIILLAEIFLMLCLFTMNATDSILQTRADSAYVATHYPKVGTFMISALFIPLYKSLDTSTLIVLERGAWWLHILGIMSFAVYVTYSKHLHIALAFPNTYFSNLEPKGKIENMAVVTAEVKSMLGIQESNGVDTPQQVNRFGAKDVEDLTWKNLMDAYSCTECGRCTAVCPANITGKLLSPRKIMMDTRDRLEEKGALLAQFGKEYDDGKSLYGNYITKEEVMACTTCNACVDACPININPLDIIVQIRQYIAMEESATPASWNAMFANIENNAAPWAFSASDRFNWATEIK
ncbi:MAG: (Fe-S)-binding protein [Cytophagales bacterium]|nr:(Fe-S)-binding protein [Bernardetiaceae bacterium]MDW8204883.1 (Fe-S)-binding protein [Cytophagales bacterium]